jgi:hypothetical protein
MKAVQYTVLFVFSLFMILAGFIIYEQDVGLDLANATKIIGKIEESYTAKPGTGDTGTLLRSFSANRYIHRKLPYE